MDIQYIEAFEALFASHKRLYWHFVLSSIVIAGIYLYWHPKERKIQGSKKLWLHPSAVLDYQYFVLSFFIKTWLIFPWLVAINTVILFSYEMLESLFGFVRVTYFSKAEVMLMFTFSLFVVSDFTRYWLHRWLHTGWLWEFHKVHHSAKVLTPLTFYRVHPIENILFGLRYALSVGVVTGVFVYLFAGYVGLIEIMGANAFLYVFTLMGSNLRHSHIKLGYPKRLESLFISPYQHQLHHQVRYTHRNFGGYLAVWDTLFGTVEYSKEAKEAPKSAIGVETTNFTTLSALLIHPFISIYQRKQR
ncbi:MAG: sterol desaturase family protein [Sulfurovum sp.]|nr:sterol desaturase family protein [Sulfurovum sp.]